MSIFTTESHCIILVCAAVRGVSFMRKLQQVEEENPTEQTLYSIESGKTRCNLSAQGGTSHNIIFILCDFCVGVSAIHI